MNHIELSVELMSILRALNYSCELKTIEGKSIVMDIAVARRIVCQAPKND